MEAATALSRKEFLVSMLVAAGAPAIGSPNAGILGASSAQTPAQDPPSNIALEDLKAAERLFGVEFSDEERQAILRTVQNNKRGFDVVRTQPIDYQIEPQTLFTPFGKDGSSGSGVRWSPTPVRGLKKPTSADDLMFLSVRELGHLVRTKQVSPVELAKLALERLSMRGEELLCLVTLTEGLALKQAKQAEEEIMRGRFRGPLHGIPYGLKDLYAVRGYPTTWGSEPHKEQSFDHDAAVYERLRDAGAVLCAKLSLGALAQGDVWFKGRTKNPWNLEQGSSGSSAGSACAVAAGLLPFAIGSETLGSIMSPSHQCRVTGLRPTYGRVSRCGAMSVSWTMDKVGPICRNAEDCALVFAAIVGADPRDRTTVNRPFDWKPKIDIKKLRLGFLIGQNDDPKDLSRLEKDDYLKILVLLGAKIRPVKFTPVPQGVNVLLSVESAAAFDEFVRSGKVRDLKNSAWPNTYRSSRYVPAVEYLQAQRARALLMRKFEEELGDLDAVVANERGGPLLLITNLTGHPQVLIPFGTTTPPPPANPQSEIRNPQSSAPRSVSFIGRIYGEATILAVANALQTKTEYHTLRPPAK